MTTDPDIGTIALERHTDGHSVWVLTANTHVSDADRIIASQRDEARKTRVLLAWIFIGIPLIGLTAWGLVALNTASHNSTIPSDSTSTVFGSADPMPPALLNTVTDNTSCADVKALATDAAMDAYSGGWDGVRAQLQIECDVHSDWTAGQALAQARSDKTAANN